MTPRNSIEERLRQAVDLFRRLPSQLPDDVTCKWPEALYDLYSRIIQPTNRHKPLTPLTLDEKHALHAVIMAFKGLAQIEQRIVWLRLEGMRWKFIAEHLNSQSSEVKIRYRHGLKVLKRHLKIKS